MGSGVGVLRNRHHDGDAAGRLSSMLSLFKCSQVSFFRTSTSAKGELNLPRKTRKRLKMELQLCTSCSTVERTLVRRASVKNLAGLNKSLEHTAGKLIVTLYEDGTTVSAALNRRGCSTLRYVPLCCIQSAGCTCCTCAVVIRSPTTNQWIRLLETPSGWNLQRSAFADNMQII